MVIILCFGVVKMPKVALNIGIVKDRLAQINPNICVLSNSYKNIHCKLKCRCLKCSYEWAQTASALLHHKTGCAKCANRVKVSFEVIKNKVGEIALDEKTYETMHSKVSCFCKKCHYKWNASLSNLVYKGHRCPKCAGNAKHTIESVKERLSKVSPKIEVLSLSVKNDASLLKLRCKRCNFEWQRSFNNLYHKKSQCPNCSKYYSSGELYLKDFLESLGLKHVDRRSLEC